MTSGPTQSSKSLNFSFLQNNPNEIPTEPTTSLSLSGSNNALKSIVYKLKNYFQVDAFAEEFIAYDGIRVFLNIIEITTGNTRVKKLN